MRKLIAKIPILYLTKLYKQGEEIPASDSVMVKAWLENEAAAWEEDINNDASFMEEVNTTIENEENTPIQDEYKIAPDELKAADVDIPIQEENENTSEEIDTIDVDSLKKDISEDAKQTPITRRNKK